MSKKKHNKDFDLLETKKQKKPKMDDKFDPSRKNKKYYMTTPRDYEYV
jgi:hypothetical protein